MFVKLPAGLFPGRNRSAGFPTAKTDDSRYISGFAKSIREERTIRSMPKPVSRHKVPFYWNFEILCPPVSLVNNFFHYFSLAGFHSHFIGTYILESLLLSVHTKSLS